MALAFTINFTFEDDKGKSSSTKIRVPSTFSIAQAVEFAQDAAQVLAIASNAVITECSISVDISLFLSGVKTVVGITADTFQKVLFSLRSSVSGLFSKMSIPTLNEDLVVQGTDVMDVTDPAVANLITALEDGIDVGLGVFVQPVDRRGNAIIEADSGREIFRKS